MQRTDERKINNSSNLSLFLFFSRSGTRVLRKYSSPLDCRFISNKPLPRRENCPSFFSRSGFLRIRFATGLSAGTGLTVHREPRSCRHFFVSSRFVPKTNGWKKGRDEPLCVAKLASVIDFLTIARRIPPSRAPSRRGRPTMQISTARVRHSDGGRNYVWRCRPRVAPTATKGRRVAESERETEKITA